MIEQALRRCCRGLASITLTLAGASCVLTPPAPRASTLEECTAALRAVDYAKGIASVLPQAQSGDAMAQFQLGFLYLMRDLDVPQENVEAAKWFRKSAEQGSSCGQNALGIIYAAGKGVPKDPFEAARWYRLAADQGHSMAQYNLGVLYREGYGVPKDEPEAAKWFQKAAEQGNEAGREALRGLRPAQ